MESSSSQSSSAAAQRRLKAIHHHLLPANHPDDVGDSLLNLNLTASQFVHSQKYSVVLPEELKTGKWNAYRFPDHPEIGTLHDNFAHGVPTFGDYKYLGTRIQADGMVGEYKWMTYGEASAAGEAIGSGLCSYGLQKGACIGLYSINRPEWLIVDHACLAYLYILVPLYDTLDAVKYVVNHADVQAVFCVAQMLNTVVRGADERLSLFRSTSGVQLRSYLELLDEGCSSLQPFRPPKPDDIATMCYTSGTTGTPKGVVLTHGNFIASVAGFALGIKFNPSDIYISFLPLAHIYERTNQIVSVFFGVGIGFYQGDNLKLLDDLAVLRPTIFCSVPWLYNRIYDGRNPSPMWDRLVFNKIREKLGGRVWFMGSGASPLSPDVMDFLRVCFGCRVLEGYGMTETCCIITLMDEGDNLSAHVGPPNPACEIKLVDIPEMNYTTDDQLHPRGEICVRGPTIFQGYYRDEVQTREVIGGDGWLHTGDVGLWLPGGRLKIIDRKKKIFKLAQGEFIAPEKVENVYTKSRFVAQCFIYGDSFNLCLVAIVAVDPDMLRDWAASEGIKDDLGQLCNDPRAKATVLADMDVVGREAQLRGFELAKAITLMPEPFTAENDLLTPTFKSKRPQAKACFAEGISSIYAKLSTSGQTPSKMQGVGCSCIH